MTALYVLVPVSIGMGLVGLAAFFWAMRHDQFEDLQGNAWRVLATPEARFMEGTPDERLAAHAEDSDTAGGL
ncbi:MAG: cbb3-type cytochrome oxidase assembly protein CcoS [Rhodobacteraceae bacterium]|uniref:cbb3-type cytochrome oxidase assembly protein CcoS n=1 Tax=Amaricoccus sp. TaxID=1872485 RepID=UPI001E00AF44|nr:cbb3-type cytochrome oxidase assembly protein CcoS [Amaricoccus sp.]MCB1370516.1 cbb3-type cytochrome oxidase assembly protein CcoS [Paracoccaceae bacterium]MCB1372651.1 cbb3-type cytochrome oxidase assembly protein CcoS [Paracoccaceae bacterium]MCB1403741.1 cbb3-type cytochrome oxidase assembly protein CcoS [Paracoccaceae bacterium]HRW15335.1 cbb3-type cytochrome oxidase assembly protein CcoS [Amaricoccus sp.]